MAIKIVTDSTADLPEQVAQKMDITVVPLNVHFGEESFQDGVDLDSDGFFHRLTTEARLPTTSQPSVGAFLQVYRGLLEAGDEVVSIHVSDKLSGTLNSALQAQEQLNAGSRLAVVDSMQVGIALGVMATAIAQAVQEGASFKETVGVAPHISEQVRVFLLLETLEYLKRGGRIGKAQAFLGSLLHVRPILTVRDGEVHPLERVRARQRGLERLYQLVEECGSLKQLWICHGTTPDDALALGERMQPLLGGDAKAIQARFGPVLGTHVGPGAIGVAVQAGDA